MAKNWPSVVEYRDALQHPERAFRDAGLKACRPEVNTMGVPRARAGAFANVYKLMQGPNPYAAVRVFLSEDSQRSRRYDLVSKHLSSHRPRCLVDFKYEPEGILVNRAWYPILTMQWVKGLSLGEWVRQAVAGKDAAKIAHMADLWSQLVEDLGRHEIAHGTLDHDNVMVVNDEPVLVDYDGMCVPALAGEPTLEFGKPAYQHPLRDQQALSLDLDRFSAWIIFITLRALAADLALYQRFNQATGNENLLFCEADIRNPEQSALWTELLAFKDSEVRDWARRLRETLPGQPFDSIPPFQVVRSSVAASPSPPVAPASPPSPLPGEVVQQAPEPQDSRGSWPSAVEYRDAITDPNRAFQDPFLKACKPEVNKMGVPRARAGAFANVYKMVHHSGHVVAVRVFLYENSLRAGRYDLVSRHVNTKSPRCLVGFKYIPHGILVHKTWYPILTMQWVSGPGLGEWVRQAVAARDAAKLAHMARQWSQLVQDLARNQVAHGDLQHDNVMVENDRPVLVDYDGMCVPALVGEPALENGKPAYQHPLREQQALSLDLDRFSAWIIYIALRALAADLTLYQRYNEATKNENLLFCEADIRHPDQSALWKELLALKDSELRDWARRLRETLPHQPFHTIPPFHVFRASPPPPAPRP